MLAWIVNVGMGGSIVDPVLPGSIVLTLASDVNISSEDNILIEDSDQITVETD